MRRSPTPPTPPDRLTRFRVLWILDAMADQTTRYALHPWARRWLRPPPPPEGEDRAQTLRSLEWNAWLVSRMAAGAMHNIGGITVDQAVLKQRFKGRAQRGRATTPGPPIAPSGTVANGAGASPGGARATGPPLLVDPGRGLPDAPGWPLRFLDPDPSGADSMSPPPLREGALTGGSHRAAPALPPVSHGVAGSGRRGRGPHGHPSQHLPPRGIPSSLPVSLSGRPCVAPAHPLHGERPRLALRSRLRPRASGRGAPTSGAQGQRNVVSS